MIRNPLLLSLLLITLMLLLGNCKREIFPKPPGMLRLSYPFAQYEGTNLNCSYRFQKNKLAELRRPQKRRKQCWYNIHYKNLKATLYLSYFRINQNLDTLVRDAQNLTQEHVVKADEITQEPYVNSKRRVFGMFYEIKGDAASPAQLYVTDSLKHFITVSLYFNTQPNYDSILPAYAYLRKDLRRFIETLEWD